MKTEYKNNAVLSMEHLEKHPRSIVEIYVEKENMVVCKEVFLDVVGSDLMQRINFLPKY